MKIQNIKSKINGKIAILGFGREGKSSLRFLKKLGAKNITILDKNIIQDKEENVYYIEGKSYLKNLDIYDIIIKSPGISPYLNDFTGLDGKITSQTEIFINNYKGKIIGITGTKGKSTTSTVINLSLQNSGYKTILVGNIGNPVLDEIDIFGDIIYDYVIYEMSSYMLEGIKPNLYIGYLNNLYDCHLDWHKGRQNYQNAKLNILKYSTNKIANHEFKNCYGNIKDIKYFGEGSNILYNDKYFYIDGKKILEDKNILLNGIHNRNNISGIMAILSTIHEDGADLNKLLTGLKNVLSSFSGLPYRIENIGTFKGITFINDALATTPDSTQAAINTFGEKIGTIFIGGQDSGFKFDKLTNIIIKYKIPNIVLFPDTGETIFGDTSYYDYETEFQIDIGDYKPLAFKTKSMKNAVKFAYEHSKSGTVCLLSTAGPSFSLWSSYLEKGDEFKKYVFEYGSLE